MGLPCPNIFAGGHNFHGRYEYVPVESMIKATEVICKIAELTAKKSIMKAVLNELQKNKDVIYNLLKDETEILLNGNNLLKNGAFLKLFVIYMMKSEKIFGLECNGF